MAAPVGQLIPRARIAKTGALICTVSNGVKNQ